MKIIFTLIFFIAYCLSITATIRYVSHTGSSTPPYTTWETAADSIQKCIDYSVNGDTIIVANGVYRESLIVNKYLWLIGSSMDSTVIDGTGLADFTVDFQSDGYIQLFTIKGKGVGIIGTSCIWSDQTNYVVENCRIKNADVGCSVVLSSPIINESTITNVNIGCYTASIDTFHTNINNSIIIINNSNDGIRIFQGGRHTAFNNNILGNQNSSRGIAILFPVIINTIRNNNISGFSQNVDGYAEDTAIVNNNVSSYAIQRGFTINSKSDFRNNVSAYNNVGTAGPTNTNSDYNLYWKNNIHTTEGFAPNDIVADPMFVNDAMPVYGGTYDYHLQAYSPAIDSGDPNILDVDGTRSDIGAYGGPGGEVYTYIDLAPRPPVNVSAAVDTSIITVKWNKNTEADTSQYNIYRDTVANFTIDPSKLISSQSDTIYIQPNPQNVESLYYKITAVDNQGNESLPSEEVGVLITSVNDNQVIIEDYILYQNYPNPFNPFTKIGYKLKERGYVKLMVYDIKGELIEVLVNQVQEAGYYETEFRSQETEVGSHLSSGIYLYRIEIIGEGNIPRFSNMKKMLLIK